MATGKKLARKSTTTKKPPQPRTKSVSFAYQAPEAQHVTIAGEFNGWDPQVHPMEKRPDGSWHASIKLKPGTYQYRVVVDGEWREDHANPNRMWDAQGICNSVIEVK